MAGHSLLDSLLHTLLETDDPTEKAAIVAESAFAQLPATVALVAQRCTILRWFDETIVTALLDALPPLERPAVAQTVVTALTTLPFVEHLAWGFAYHDQTRTGLLARTSPIVLQHAAALAVPAYDAHANPSLARVEALYCAVVSCQVHVATQTLNALLEDTVRREDWQALLTAFHALEEASALPFAASMPRTALHYTLCGLARHELGDLAGAITDYDKAIALDPADVRIYNNRGLARSNQGDFAGAIADYTQAIALDPANTRIYNNRGLARRNQGDLAGAIADYTQAIALDLFDLYDAKIYANRGNVRSSQGDLAGAIADYTQAIALDPANANAYYNRGLARSSQGDFAGAIADYTQAIALDPANTRVYNNRGNVRRNQGDFAGAIADYTQAIALDPANANAYYNRGLACSNQGDFAGAIADYNQYLELGGGMRDGDQEEVEQHIHALRIQFAYR